MCTFLFFKQLIVVKTQIFQLFQLFRPNYLRNTTFRYFFGPRGTVKK